MSETSKQNIETRTAKYVGDVACYSGAILPVTGGLVATASVEFFKIGSKLMHADSDSADVFLGLGSGMIATFAMIVVADKFQKSIAYICSGLKRSNHDIHEELKRQRHSTTQPA